MLLLNYSTLIDPLLQDIRIYTTELLGKKEARQVLDICCGTGDQVFHYGRKGMIATGIDQNPSMISQAEKNRHKHTSSDISFLSANATDLPFDDGYFDGASISLGLHEMNRAEQDEAISETKRAVKKGGTLIFIDFQVPFPSSR